MTATKTHPMVKQHADAVAARKAAKTPGVAAGASRRIARLELEMTLEGVEFTAWTAPKRVTTHGPTLSDDDLMTRLRKVRIIALDAERPTSLRLTAEQESRRLAKLAVARGIEIPAKVAA
jgi:hypothetical protein